MNKVILIGRLTKEPELRYTSSNIAVASFTLAVNRPKQKDREQEADFINVVVWDKQAENIKKYVFKGSQVAIEGRIQTRTYDTDKGEKRYATEVVANNVQFLESKTVKSDMQNTAETNNDSYVEMGNPVSLDEYELPFEE